jgi:hypothetical protein
MIANAVAGVTASFNAALKAYEWIKELQLLTRLAPYASGLVTFLSSTFGALFLTALTPAALLLYLAKGEKEEIEKDPFNEKYKDNPYAMKLRGEATTIGQATVVNQNKALKQFPRRTVEDFVNSNRSDEELKLDLGNDRPTLKKWLADNPNRDAMYQAPVAAIAGQPQTAIPAGGKPSAKMSLPEDVTPSTAGAGRGSAESATTDPRRLDLPTPTTTPVPQTPVSPTQTTTPIPQTPVSSRMNDAVQENQDLSITQTGNTQTASAPIISSSSNSVDLPDRPIPATATVRDKTPILDHVLQQSLAPV